MESCGAEGLPHEIVGVKREPEVYQPPPDASYALEVQVKVEPLDIPNEDKSVKEDMEQLHEMKDEPCSGNLQNEAAKQVSQAAMLVSLYADHEVKDDLVLGQESLHKPDVNLVIQEGCGKRPFTVKECCVRLNRQPHFELLSNKLQNTVQDKRTTHADSEMEEGVVSHRVDCKTEPTCDLCGQCFALKSDLMKHVMEHIYVPTSTTDASGQDYADASQERALRRKHALRDCSVRLKRLPHHEALPSNQRLTAEDITRAGTESNTGEKIMRVHRENNPKCDICGRIFTLISDLKKHVMIHIHVPTRVQSEAPTIYPEISDTDEEININIDRDYEPVCDLCGEKFNSGSDLMKHVMIHLYVATSNQQPLYKAKVQKCVDSSNTKTLQRNEFQYQNKHIKTYSKIKSDFKCVRIEEKPYSRDTSKINFEKKECRNELEIHNKNKHLCKICKKDFKTLTRLKKHILVPTSLRPFTCVICQKSFPSKECFKAHSEIHKREKPYYCKVCNKLFVRLQYLRQHIKYATSHKEMEAYFLKKKTLGNKIGMTKHFEF